MASSTYGLNTIVYTNADGDTQTISVDVANGTIDFGDLEIVANSVTTSGGGSSGGAIDTISITVTGTGFEEDETGSFYNKTGSGSGGTWKIISVNGSGGPTDIEITDGGSGYAVNDVLYINEEAESGETRPEITVTAIE